MSDVREALTDPAVQSSWRVIDEALQRLAVPFLTADEVGAWSLLQYFHERALPELSRALRGEK